MSFRKYLIEANKMYHGTVHQFDRMRSDRDEYMVDRAIGTHFASDKNVAQKFADGLYRKDSEKREGKPRLLTANAPKRSELEKVYQKNYRNKEGKVFAKQSDQSAVGAHVAHTVFSQEKHKDLFTTWVKASRHIDDETANRVHAALMAGKAPHGPEFGHASTNRNSSFRSFVSNFDANLGAAGKERKRKIVDAFVDHMRNKGIKGLTYQNTSPSEKNEPKRSNKAYIIFDPEHLELK